MARLHHAERQRGRAGGRGAAPEERQRRHLRSTDLQHRDRVAVTCNEGTDQLKELTACR